MMLYLGKGENVLYSEKGGNETDLEEDYVSKEYDAKGGNRMQEGSKKWNAINNEDY